MLLRGLGQMLLPIDKLNNKIPPLSKLLEMTTDYQSFQAQQKHWQSKPCRPELELRQKA